LENIKKKTEDLTLESNKMTDKNQETNMSSFIEKCEAIDELFKKLKAETMGMKKAGQKID
jgi:hypothetical protein